MKTFSVAEKTIAKNIDKEYKWMARDQDGNLCIYEEKPKKAVNCWHLECYYEYISYFNHLFPAIKWEDDEPTLIRDIYNPQVLDNAEREYLKTVLKPFHEEVDYIEKSKDTNNKEYLYIELYDGMLEFHNFDSGKMYSGMELDKEYKLDELGITYEGES